MNMKPSDDYMDVCLPIWTIFAEVRIPVSTYYSLAEQIFSSKMDTTPSKFYIIVAVTLD